MLKEFKRNLYKLYFDFIPMWNHETIYTKLASVTKRDKDGKAINPANTAEKCNKSIKEHKLFQR